ncbi:MAG: hypothetical protein K2M51_03205 [Helicobacter sp.]|nr:hypothetical protein [Helicobacter sp.]MBD5167956.1 hypothetical protein [Helicobacter sp.]MDE5816727.1 hypothetical protein [Helicobacter sp.]MDE6045436.1 hypothetical protein [Helicobacter sp.]MDE7195609.1 hypothetical protein [Helicobacter sp.]
MTQLNLMNTSNPYERLANYSKTESNKDKDSEKLAEQGNSNTNANTAQATTSQDSLDKLNASGELTNATTALSEKTLNALKSRLQSTEAELARLDQQIKSLSTGSTNSMKSVLVGQNNVGSTTGAGLAASVADMARAEVAARAESAAQSADSNANTSNANSGKSEAEKANIREAMMRYLSVERSVRIAEMMTLQQQIAQAQGL